MKSNAWGLTIAVGFLWLSGCGGGRAFRVTHHHGPWVARATTGEVAVLDDGSDATHGLLARAIAGRLSADEPAQDEHRDPRYELAVSEASRVRDALE